MTIIAVGKIIMLFVCIAFFAMESVIVTVIIRETVLWMKWRWEEKHGKKEERDE